MPKVTVRQDEDYLYVFQDEERYMDFGSRFEVSQQVIDRWKAANEAWDKAQHEMRMVKAGYQIK